MIIYIEDIAGQYVDLQNTLQRESQNSGLMGIDHFREVTKLIVHGKGEKREIDDFMFDLINYGIIFT